MEALGALLGWMLFGITGLFALSGLGYVYRAASGGGSVSHMGLCQWALSITALLVFGFGDVNKLHLLWVIPVGFFASFTIIGQAVGFIVGLATAVVFRGART